MSEEHLDNDEFFTKLTSLFTQNQKKAHGSIFLTQKRSISTAASQPGSDPLADLHPEDPVPILVRAHDAKSVEKRKMRVKISTIVEPNDLDSFFSKYAEVCKAGMSGLKKRDRSKRKKDKAKKRKAGGEAEKKG